VHRVIRGVFNEFLNAVLHPNIVDLYICNLGVHISVLEVAKYNLCAIHVDGR